MQIKPTIVIVLDTRRKKISGLYPIKLRVTFLKVQRYYPIGVDLSQDEFDLMLSLNKKSKDVNIKLKRRLQEIEIKCEASKAKANEVVNKLSSFSFVLFEKKFLTGQYSINSIYIYYVDRVKELKKEGRIGTASNYNTSMNSLKKFSPKLPLVNINIEFLKSYEKWLLDRGKSESTVGIYLRPLRAIINEAIEDGSFMKECYPFGKRRYQIPASRNLKKALTLQEIGQIASYTAVPGSWEEKARDFFLFSYFANGINIKDILLLKNSDFDGEYLRFIRAKTRRTNRSSTSVITIYLNDELKSIIQRWRNTKIQAHFIFPVLEKGISPEREMAVIQQFTKMINKYLKKIMSELDINKPVTTYYARHSFATVLKKSGVSPLFISESLGHSSIKTTESYLDSFEDEQRKVILENLSKY